MSIRCHTLNGLRIHSWKFINSVTYSHHRCISMCNRACSESDDDADVLTGLQKCLTFYFNFISLALENQTVAIFFISAGPGSAKNTHLHAPFLWMGHGYYHEASNELTYLPWLSAVQTLHCLSCKTNANQFIKNIVQWFN